MVRLIFMFFDSSFCNSKMYLFALQKLDSSNNVLNVFRHRILYYYDRNSLYLFFPQLLLPMSLILIQFIGFPSGLKSCGISWNA